MITKITGELEIDHARGVIYFHAAAEELEHGGIRPTPLRICRLGPIPFKVTFIDITEPKYVAYEQNH